MPRLDTWRLMVLVIHADYDRIGACKESVPTVEALRERGGYVKSEVHGWPLRRRWIEAYGAAADFFLRLLRGLP